MSLLPPGSSFLTSKAAFCQTVAAPVSKSKSVVKSPCGRGLELTCRAAFDGRPQEAMCCNKEELLAAHSAQERVNGKMFSGGMFLLGEGVMRWPRPHVEASLALMGPWGWPRAYDFSFVGGMDGKANHHDNRRWVRDFAASHFTQRSLYARLARHKQSWPRLGT